MFCNFLVGLHLNSYKTLVFSIIAFFLTTITVNADEIDEFLQSEVTPLPRAHAHNDYEHDNPLFDALNHGFCSVEADVHLGNGTLYIAHDLEDIKENKTLERLYLDPLNKIIEKNNGEIYDCKHPFILLIDIKTEAKVTYLAVHNTLKKYEDIFSYYNNGKIIEGVVMAIISGSRPRELMKSQNTRYAFYDGRLSDLGSKEPHNFMPLISDDWNEYFLWNKTGNLPSDMWNKIFDIAEKVHSNNRMLRFWNVPVEPLQIRTIIWKALLEADIDLINSDDLEGLKNFLIENDKNDF